MEMLGGKGRHSPALLIRACDSYPVPLTPAAPEEFKGVETEAQGTVMAIGLILGFIFLQCKIRLATSGSPAA